MILLKYNRNYLIMPDFKSFPCGWGVKKFMEEAFQLKIPRYDKNYPISSQREERYGNIDEI